MAMAGLNRIPCSPAYPLWRLPPPPAPPSRPSLAPPLSSSCSPSSLPLRRSCRLLAAAPPGPPPPEQPDNPLGVESDPVAGIEAKLNRAWDGAQIFFAVLFWMSLFFWASLWDGNDNNRPKKGGWFKR